jgi:hypothetical protein
MVERNIFVDISEGKQKKVVWPRPRTPHPAAGNAKTSLAALSKPRRPPIVGFSLD